ncbi:hypothetical protein F7R91_28280 [Streptomyces luteolifulvus]|jgi:hypothetical protein|uniref:DUF3592 domain-containing protein n=1 Tax=Streptomyces luteolifulvus TaxID=2615112 RepID=A0A6H9UUZ5_9ACTN|nr:hypothetical protein [Streptomyces luteolifulvus]KAB1142694.1 hypothetical protein F7R91_28280 [Streptomyces luteolifulvus]
MDLLFYVVPSLMIAIAVFAAYRVVRRWLQIRGAWNSGLTAEGRCLRAYTTTHGGSNNSSVRTTLHHVYEFTARDGRAVRFEEEDGPGTIVEGDFVTVYYTEGREVVATALPPRRGKQAAATFGILAFLGVFVAFCIGFMIQYAVVFETSDTGGF